MTDFDAIYYDGRTSIRRPVRVRVAEGILRLAGDRVDLEVPAWDVRVEAPVAGSRHLLSLPGGGQLQTDDAAAVARAFPAEDGAARWLRVLERRWAAALAATVVIAAIAAWTIVYGLPIAAAGVARHMPEALQEDAGEQSLAALDRLFCSESTLGGVRQQALRLRLQDVVANLPDRASYSLEFRACPRIGANALALPGHTIVMTDELVAIAGDDERIATVLAHEAGHVLHRHPMRMALQGAGLAALVTTLAGDAVSITSMAAAVPVLLLETGYSREFEEEADDYAFERMRQAGIPPRRFAEMMTRLEASHGNRSATDSDGKSLDYLSTHPDTAKRIQRALAH